MPNTSHTLSRPASTCPNSILCTADDVSEGSSQQANRLERCWEGFLEEVTLNQLQGVPQEGVVDPGGEVGLSYAGDQFCALR